MTSPVLMLIDAVPLQPVIVKLRSASVPLPSTGAPELDGVETDSPHDCSAGLKGLSARVATRISECDATRSARMPISVTSRSASGMGDREHQAASALSSG